MYDRVLVPTEGGEGTGEFLDHAVALAECHDATVHLLYVVDRRRYRAAPEDVGDQVLAGLRTEGESAVEEAAAAVREAGLEAVTAVEEGIPYRGIIEYAENGDADVIVMGTHGRTGRDRLVHLGSVTERVIKHVDIPVFVVDIGEA